MTLSPLDAARALVTCLSQGEPVPDSVRRALTPHLAPPCPLERARDLGADAATFGFDWPTAAGVRNKVAEELAELDAARDPSHQTEELGDVLFSLTQLGRHLDTDAATALHAACDKFEARVAAMRAASAQPLHTLDAAALDAAWRRAKETVGCA